MRKFYLLVFVIHLLLFSCVTVQEDISATTVPSATVSATVLFPVIPAETATPNLIPRHNDLTFLEFFAVT